MKDCQSRLSDLSKQKTELNEEKADLNKDYETYLQEKSDLRARIVTMHEELESIQPVAGHCRADNCLKLGFPQAALDDFTNIAGEVYLAMAGPGKLKTALKWTAYKFNPSKLEKHFNKHQHKWKNGEITSLSEYQAKAEKLLNSNIGGDVKGFTNKDGWLFKYNSRTNEFSVAKPDGTIETLFKPDRGINYWYDQVKKYE
ncbi:hypothetical protein [Endozoicomonas numazuensis]|uniref:hypothetical protein n=1 Tax=Endozoicomonas numazuensis TaxID=1137799 RepID=UPI0013769F76|nr:hypothetical protein [Endozoicomonas numazuensis]